MYVPLRTMYAPLCLLVSLAVIFADPGYRNKIPNGHHVPDPCHAHQFWQPVGHFASNPHLASHRNVNPFGQDFDKAGRTWTKILCHEDSDNDGTENGVELGDPHCTWTNGSIPEGSATGHPGINEKTFDCSGVIG